MVTYNSKIDADLSVILAFLGANGISPSRIVSLIHNGTAYVCVYSVA